MIYLYSFTHILFVFAVLFCWRIFDKKYDYKNYIRIAIVVGVVISLLFDFAGVYIFRFWEYYSSNAAEYAAIALSTYIIATPLMIETLNFFFKLLRTFKIHNPRSTNKSGIKLNSSIAFTLLVISIAVVWAVAYSNHYYKESITWLLLITLFVAGLTVFDCLVYLFRGIKGPILSVFDGRILAPFSVLVSGFIIGFFWELINLIFPLWFYKNLPPESVFGVPLAVIIFWGMLNMAYWACASIVFGKAKQ